MFYLVANWNPRAESPEDCAQRLSRCLSLLVSGPGPFKDWFLQGRSAKEARQHPQPLDAESLAKLVRSGAHRRDDNKQPIPELGYTVGLWNGSRHEPVSISLTCGAQSADPNLANAFVMSLPPITESASFYCERASAKALIMAVASAWEAEAAAITSDVLRAETARADHLPQIGWMTYLSERKAQELPRLESVESVPGGVLITLADRCDDVTPDSVRQVYDRLASD